MSPHETPNHNNDNDNDNNNDKDKLKPVVEVEAVLTTVSSTPVDPPGRTTKLTALDRAMGQHNLHVIFYYKTGSLDFDRAKLSWNQVLTLYPNVTGRLAKDEDGSWKVKFTDAGVRVYLAKARRGCVDEWLRVAGGEDELQLTVCDEVPDDPRYWSPFRMQITHFEGGGSALALSCPHMLADPMTVTLLIKSWTDTHHQLQITHPPFLHPLALSAPPKPKTTPYRAPKSDKLNPEHTTKMDSATFCFSDSAIRECLSEFCCSVLDATPFDVLIALFWTRIAKLKSKALDSEQKIVICIDMRKRMKAPLPYGYFGNAMYFSDLTIGNEHFDSNDVGHVAEMVHRLVTGVTEEEFMSTIGWLESRKDDQGKYAPPFKMYGPELTCVNMEHMFAPKNTHGSESEAQPLMYMASFDKDQTPAHVSYRVTNAEGEGLIFVLPSPDGGLARRVSVTLPEEEIQTLLEDDVILRLKPTLLLSGRG
ncbi:hypothetical protein vseg_021387 [Gypsophila vaccaria]